MVELYKKLKEFGQVKSNAPLSKLTTFKIGGSADFLIEVATPEKLVALLNYLSGEGVAYFILGGGSNVLLPDEGMRGVVIKIKDARYAISDSVIEASAGVMFGVVINTAPKYNLTGLEWAAGLPGTVGGAVRGNAGAMGGDTAHVLQKVQVWRDGEVFELTPEACGFGYRESIFKHNSDVILKAWFKLAPGDAQKSLATMQDIVKKRNGHYPPFPSAGSFFKNVLLKDWPSFAKVTADKASAGLLKEFVEQERVPAGWLVEKAGLKSFRVGGAMVSKEHGNFLINVGNATHDDVRAVLEEVKQRVYSMFGVVLEEEVHIVN